MKTERRPLSIHRNPIENQLFGNSVTACAEGAGLPGGQPQNC